MSRLRFNGANSAFEALPFFQVEYWQLPITPSQTSEADTKSRTLRVKFGDGYEQRAKDGINNLTVNFSLVFQNRSVEVITAIDDFLRGRSPFDRESHEPFLWTPPEPYARLGELLFVPEDDWKVNFVKGRHSTLTCKFMQVFDLGD